MALDHKTGTAPAGVNATRRIPCRASKHHGHHPENEACSYCPPPPAIITELDESMQQELADYFRDGFFAWPQP